MTTGPYSRGASTGTSTSAAALLHQKEDWLAPASDQIPFTKLLMLFILLSDHFVPVYQLRVCFTLNEVVRKGDVAVTVCWNSISANQEGK
jgi:hypothetical protein